MSAIARAGRLRGRPASLRRRSQQRDDRTAAAVGDQMNLRGQATPRPAESLPTGHPFVIFTVPLEGASLAGACRAPAACWCARITVESALTVQSSPSASSHPARSPSRIRSHGPVQRPAAMPVVDRLPQPATRRQVTPDDPSPGPEEDPVDHRPMVLPPCTPHRVHRQQRFQPRPLIIRQIVAFQTFLVHAGDLHQDRNQDHGTRPSVLTFSGPGVINFIYGLYVLPHAEPRDDRR